MEYRAEIYRDNKMVMSQLFVDVTHPTQAVRRLLNRADVGRYVIYVINEVGGYWIYSAKVAGNAVVRLMGRGEVELDMDSDDMVMSGNRSVRGMVS